MPMLEGRVDAVIGVDTHRDSHAAALLDPNGGVRATLAVPSDRAGHARLLQLAVAQAPGRRVWALEGTGCYGAGLTGFLVDHGEWVVEIDRPSAVRGQVLMSFGVQAHMSVAGQAGSLQGTRAVHEIRPLLARRGFAIPGMPGVRLRTLADVVAYAQAEGVELRVDGTETQVRRPRANRWGRRAFVSGKKRQNTIKVTTVCDRQGRTLWAGAVRPGRMHDQTAIKTEGIEDLLRRHHDVHAKVDAGYRGLAKAFGGRVHAPPPKPAKAARPEELAAWQQARTQQSSQRICVEHANAEHKQWRALQRWIGRREYYAQTHLAIAGLVSDRTARR